jgi:hypothetical protein
MIGLTGFDASYHVSRLFDGEQIQRVGIRLMQS